MSRYLRHLIYRFFPLLVVIGTLLSIIHLDTLSRIPAFAFMVTPNGEFDHREFIRRNADVNGWIIQKMTLPKDTYRLRFSIFPGEVHQQGAFHAYLVTTSGTLITGYNIPLKDFVLDTNTVSIYFPPVEAGDYYLGFRFTEASKGFAGLAATNPARVWNLCGPVWYQEWGKLVRTDKSCLWKLTAYRYMSFKEMVERISQYGEIKGFRMILLFVLFAFAFALFWREWMAHVRYPVLVSLLLGASCFAVSVPIVQQRVGNQRFYPIPEAPAADMQQFRELLKSITETPAQPAPQAAQAAPQAAAPQATPTPQATPVATPQATPQTTPTPQAMPQVTATPQATVTPTPQATPAPQAAVQPAPTPKATPQATPQVTSGTAPKATAQVSSSTVPRK